MLYCDAEGGAKGVNAPKPPLYAGKSRMSRPASVS